MTQNEVLLPVDQIKWVRDLYPRLREDDAAIERYRAALDRLPPIIVARGRVLVDGFHRLQAHKREKLKEIATIDLGDITDSEIIRESYRRNAEHGVQLSEPDKRNAAERLYFMLDGQVDERYEEIADLLSISVRTARLYAKDARQKETADQKERAWDLWLNCLTQQQVADEIGRDQKTVSNWLGEMATLPDFLKPPDSRQHFDIWQFQNSDGTTSYFGAMPPQVVENLLWLYTEPGQVIIDPFAGSGTTIDVAKQMGRRIWAADLTPSTPTLPIHEHDATQPWPAPLKANLILLDPPYWQQAKGRYSDAPTDLGNLTLDDFMAAWKATIRNAKAKLANDGRIAFVVSPTQLENGDVVDHAFAMAQAAKMNIERRIIVPYQTQQATGQQVEWAREHRRLLKLYRDLVVLRP